MRLLTNTVLVKPDEQKMKTDSGIFLTTGNAKYVATTGEVIAVSPKKMTKDYVEIPMECSAGDYIYFKPRAGNEFKNEGQDYLILKEDDIVIRVTGSTVRVLSNSLLVEPDPVDVKSEGGIFITPVDEQGRPVHDRIPPLSGKVIQTGKGKYTDSGVLIPMTCKAGDKVHWAKDSGDEVVLNKVVYLVISEDQILATEG